MKKIFQISLIFVLMLAHLSFLIIPAKSATFLLFQPSPEINSNKNIYKSDEIIYINSKWNIFIENSELTHINIIFSTQNPSECENLDLLKNSLWIIECIKKNGSNSESYSVKITDLFSNSTQFVDLIYISLFIYDDIEISNKYCISISIKIERYYPTLIKPIKFSNFEDYMFLENNITAQENSLIYYPKTSINVKFFNETSIIFDNNVMVTDYGYINISINGFNTFQSGLYTIQFNFSENILFEKRILDVDLNIINPSDNDNEKPESNYPDEGNNPQKDHLLKYLIPISVTIIGFLFYRYWKRKLNYSHGLPLKTIKI